MKGIFWMVYVFIAMTIVAYFGIGAYILKNVSK